MNDSNRLPEEGIVQTYSAKRGFGFISLERGGQLFFHFTRLFAIGMDVIAPGTPVQFVRGVDRDGREQVDRFVQVDGEPVHARSFKRINGQLVLDPVQEDSLEKGSRPLVECTSPVAEQPARHQTSPQSIHTPPAQKRALSASEWITVRVAKLRRERTSYGESDLGSVTIPWSVCERARITSVPRNGSIQARCSHEGNTLTALEIKRL